MPGSHVTLRDFFTLGRDGQAPAGQAQKTLDSLGDKVSVHVKDANIEPSVLLDAILGNLDGLLDIELSSLIGAAWSKARLLQQYRDKSRYRPNEAIMVAMAEHTIRSTHRPSIELLINNRAVESIPIEISFQMAVEGLVLKIENGRIKEIRPGTCSASGRIACRDWIIAEHETRPFVLPGVLSFGDGIEIPSLDEGRG